MNDEQQEAGWLRKVAVLAAGVPVVGVGVTAILAPANTLKILISVAVVLLVVLAPYFLWRWHRRRQERQGLKSAFLSFFDTLRRGRDANATASLEQLKAKFESLIRELESVHKNIYDMPWFLIIGPSGAGKSWVLKAVGLHPVDEERNSGPSERETPREEKGTVFMDWWKWSDGFVLDTAGGMVFPEEKVLDTEEWKRLLELLKLHRPQRPFNGLFVVIPAEMLLLDSSELCRIDKEATGAHGVARITLTEYADSLRRQIRERLQKALQLRFPLYFLITKSDRIPGFREFADQIKSIDGNGDDRVTQQILGWSTPRKISELHGKKDAAAEAFEPAETASFLREIAGNLRRARAPLLATHAGAAAGGTALAQSTQVQRQAAEWFAFPAEIERLGEKLQSFVTTVFAPDSCAPAPPFVRGIYFTSAMREGEVLESIRARVLGKSTLAELALPGVGTRDAKKAFFLHDLFFEKAFRESGLVMPLVSARNYLLERRRQVLWSLSLSCAAFLLALGIGGYQYHRTVGRELDLWGKKIKPVVEEPANRYWLEVIRRNPGGGSQIVDDNLATQLELAQRSAQDVKVGFGGLFDPWGNALARKRSDAQRLLFERGVILPLADFARSNLVERTRADLPDKDRLADESDRLEGVLAALLELESSGTPTNLQDLAGSGERVVGGLLAYLIEGPAGVVGASRGLAAAVDQTYRNKRDGWPPSITRDDRWSRETLDAAFGRMEQLQKLYGQQLRDKQSKFVKLIEDLKAMKRAELALLRAFEEAGTDAIKNQLKEIKSAWQQVSGDLDRQQIASLGAAFTNLQSQGLVECSNRLMRVRERLLPIPAARGPNGLKPDLELLLAKLGNAMTNEIRAVLRVSDLVPDASALDAEFVKTTNSGRVFDDRILVYDKVLSLDPKDDLPARLASQLAQKPESAIDDTVGKQAKAAADQTVSAADVLKTLRTDGNLDPNKVLRAHILRLYLERTVEVWGTYSKDMVDGLRKGPSLNDRDPPSETVRKILQDLDVTGKLKPVWDQLKRAFEDKEFQPADAIRAGLQSIQQADEETKRKLLALLRGEMNGGDFPLGDGPKDLTPTEVQKKWARAKEWEAALNDTGGNSNGSRDAKRSLDGWEEPRKEIEAWLKRFDDCVEPAKKGDRSLVPIKKYVLEFATRQELAGVFGDTKAAEAEESHRKFYWWEFKEIQAEDDLRRAQLKSLPFQASTKFSVAAWTERGRTTPVKIYNPPIKTNWTVIELIRRDTTIKAPDGRAWYVLFSVGAEDQTGTVWIRIREETPP